MVCRECSKIVCMQAFCSSKCRICDTIVNTSHIPGYKICESCAKKLKICPQCGKNHMNICISCNDNLTINEDNVCDICKHKTNNPEKIS